MSLKNITVKQYSQTKDVVEYDSLLSALSPSNIFCGKKFELGKLTYNNVRAIEKFLRNGKTFNDLSKAFQLSFGITNEEFFGTDIVDFYGARNFLIFEIESIMLREKELLKTDGVDVNAWEQAGGKSLEPLSEILPLVKLGKIYSIYPLDLGNKPYNEIMLLLVTHKRSDSVEDKYRELTRPKPVKK